MMRRFLRGFSRLLVSLALGAGAGVLGWCWIGWINGTPNSPRELYQKPAESASNGSSNSNAWKTLLNQSRRGNAEARVRELYAMSKSLTASERKELRNEMWKSPNRYLETLLSEDEDAPDHFAGSVYLATVLRTWMAGDHASCLAAIEQLPPHLRSQIPTRLLKAATMLNGQAALKLLGPSLMQMIPPAGLDVTLQAWADQDAAGALAFAQQMTGPEARQKAMAGVLRSMAISDPNRCLQMLASLPPESSKQLTKDLALRLPYQNVLDNFEQLRSLGGKDAAFPALERLAATDPAAAAQWLQAHPSAWEGAAWAAMQADPFGSREPLLNLMTQAILTGNGDVAKMSDKLTEMSGAWARSFGQNPQVEDWVQAQTNPAVRAPVLLGIVEATYAQARPVSKTLAYWNEAQQLDPAAAAKSNVYWVNSMVSQLDGPLPSDVVSTFTNQQLARIFQDRPQLLNPNDAMSMSLEIQDFEERQQVSYKIIDSYGTRNPQEVQEWIQQLPTDEERATMTNRLVEISKQKPYEVEVD